MSKQNIKKEHDIQNQTEKETENPRITVLSKEDTEKVLLKMQEAQDDFYCKKIEHMENHIETLHRQISVMIENEKQTHEYIVNLMTTVEEVLHTLEEAGLTQNSILLDDNDDLIVSTGDNTLAHHDDVVSSNANLKNQIKSFQNETTNKKDFNLN